MDAKEYIRERERMLNSLGRLGGRCSGVFCGKCYLHSPNTALGCLYSTEKAIDIVEAWSKEHPKKTYLDVLLEAFPKTPVGKNGLPLHVCPYAIGLETYDESSCLNSDYKCNTCWHREYKEADDE